MAHGNLVIRLKYILHLIFYTAQSLTSHLEYFEISEMKINLPMYISDYYSHF